jgi:hypothetical protein
MKCPIFHSVLKFFEIFNQILSYHPSILIAACKVLDIPQAIPDVALLPTPDIVQGSLVKSAFSPIWDR